MRSTGMNDPRDAMIQCAADLLGEVEINKPPVDLRLLGSFQRVKDIQRVKMVPAGRLIPDGCDLIIQVNVSHTRGKQNFTIGHEIGHTLLFNYQTKSYIIEDLVTGQYQQGQEEEYLCDVAAAELLMPTALFRPQAETKGISLDTVAEFADMFQASREATAIQLVKTNLWPCALALWHHTYTPQQERLIQQSTFAGFEAALPSKKLRLRYAVPSSSFGQYLYPYLAAQADGCLMQCYSEGGIVCGEERLELRNKYVPFYVMAAAIEFVGEAGSVREVFSLLLPKGVVLTAHETQPDLWLTLKE